MEIVQTQEDPRMIIMALNSIVEAAARDQDSGVRGKADEQLKSSSKRRRASLSASSLMLPLEGTSLSRLTTFLQAAVLYQGRPEVSHDPCELFMQ